MTKFEPIHGHINQIRNAEIWRLYKENRMTLAAIGKMFNLSRQRVYQIVQAKKELVEHTKNWDKPFV